MSKLCVTLSLLVSGVAMDSILADLKANNTATCHGLLVAVDKQLQKGDKEICQFVGGGATPPGNVTTRSSMAMEDVAPGDDPNERMAVPGAKEVKEEVDRLLQTCSLGETQLLYKVLSEYRKTCGISLLPTTPNGSARALSSPSVLPATFLIVLAFLAKCLS